MHLIGGLICVLVALHWIRHRYSKYYRGGVASTVIQTNIKASTQVPEEHNKVADSVAMHVLVENQVLRDYIHEMLLSQKLSPAQIAGVFRHLERVVKVAYGEQGTSSKHG